MRTRTPAPHSHVWIDPDDPPIARASYAPWVGPRRRELKAGGRYVCRACGAILIAPSPHDTDPEVIRL